MPQPSGNRCLALLALAILALVLAATPATAVAGDAGELAFVSAGGMVSGEYQLNVTVDWRLERGTVRYGLDGAEPTEELAHAFGPFYEATVPTDGLADGRHTLEVRAEDPTGNTTSAFLELDVDNHPPQVTITSEPPDLVTDEYEVTANVLEPYVEQVLVVLDGNRSDARAMAGSGTIYTYVIDAASEWMCGYHNVSVVAIDELGRETCTENITLLVDVCAPMVMFMSEGGHVMGIYDLMVSVMDITMDADAVFAVFDGDRVNKTKMSHSGDGTFSYKFDTTTLTEGDHRVCILATDGLGRSSESEPLVLKVDNAPPKVRVLSEGGAVAGFFTVSAQVTDAYLNDSAVWLVVDDDHDNGTAMTWRGDRFELNLDTCMLADGVRNITVWALDMWGQGTESAVLTLDVDNNPPMITITSAGGKQWGKYQVRATVYDPHLNTSCVTVKVGGAEPAVMMYYANNDYWYYDVDTTGLTNGPLAITVSACDHRDNVNAGVTKTIDVENRADLTIISVDWTKMEVEEGAKTRVSVQVRNDGYTTVKDFNVVLVSGSKVLDSVSELTGIRAGKVHTYTLEWKAEGKGAHEFMVRVDNDNAVEEFDETNNAWEEQTIQVTSGGSSVPGMGAALAMLAAAGAGLASRRRR